MSPAELAAALRGIAEDNNPASAAILNEAADRLDGRAAVQKRIAALRCVQAGWAFGVPEDGRQQWLDMVEEAVNGP